MPIDDPKPGSIPADDYTPPPSMARSASDWATSFIRGLAKGTEGMAGLPGDAAEMGARGIDRAARAVGGAVGIDVPERKDRDPTYGTAAVDRLVGGAEGKRNVVGKFIDEKSKHPYAESVGEFVPGLVGGGEGTVARTLLKKGAQAVGGGVGSEAAGELAQSIAPDHETAARVLGGIAGQGLPGVVRKAVAPSNIKPEREAAAKVLKKQGVDVTAGDLSGSKPVKYAEHALGTSPGSGGAYDAVRDKINKQFTSASLKHIGETSDELSPEVLRRASKTIGGEFDGLAARNTVKPDMPYVADLLKAEQKYNDLFLNPLHKDLVKQLVKQQMANVSRGDLSGKAYQAQASALREIQMGHGDPRVRDFAADLKDGLDDAMERSIKKNNPDDFGKWKEARKKYRNLLVLERVAAGGGEEAASGVVSPARLRQAIVAEQGRRSYARGYGDFDELARAGNMLLTKPPTSGTTERAFLHAIPAGIGATIGHALEGNAGSAAGTMLGLAAPGAVGKTLMSETAQSYLKNQLARKLGIDPAELDKLRPGWKDKAARSALAEHGRSYTLPPITVDEGDQSPMEGARKAPDGNWYIDDPNRQGKYLQINP